MRNGKSLLIGLVLVVAVAGLIVANEASVRSWAGETFGVPLDEPQP